MPVRLFCILGKFDFNIVIEASKSRQITFQKNLNFDSQKSGEVNFLMGLIVSLKREWVYKN